MASLLNKKAWRLQDIVRRDGNEELVRIVKLTHPFRLQRITIVPTPRYAREAFYNEWVYQPYVKEHRLYVSNDIFHPFYVFLCRPLLRRDRFPGYAYFHPMALPDGVDVNITRRRFMQRELPFRSPMLPLLLTSVRYRDTHHHRWVARRVRGIVGDHYLVHPKDDQRSVVFVVPPAYVPQMLNTLQDLGFVVADSATAAVGDGDTLRRLHRLSEYTQRAVLLYLWLLTCLGLAAMARQARESFDEYKRDMVRRAGKDPAKMGL